MSIHCFQIEYPSAEMAEALFLRNLVLRIPLGLEFNCDDIAGEWDSYHLVASNQEEEILGVLVLKPLDEGVIKMRQVAIKPGVQKTGIGKQLVEFSEVFARQKQFRRIELNARMEAVPFYLRLGYQKKGKIFKEVGIDHVFMYKNL